MKMNKCVDCKFWENKFKTINPKPDYCKCLKLSDMVETIQGVQPIFGTEVDEEIFEEYLDTGKDFGCIHFESR